MVLEEVALDAECENGRLIARTSARQVAEGLGIDPGTAAGALRALRQKGVLALERESGVAGRFGLAVYVLATVDGLFAVTTGTRLPGVGGPHMGQPLVAASDPVEAHAERPKVRNKRRTAIVPNGDVKPRGDRREAVGQGALDLGLGSG
jgi:DNA-binding transcriptional ArsR family regulator